MFVALLLTLPAVAAPIVPTSISASSSYPAENGVSYSAKNLLDGRGDTAWIEGDRGSGLGASVELQLGEAREVRAVDVWNGYQASGDLFARHNRVKEVEVTLSDGTKVPFTLKDAAGRQTLTFPKPTLTSSLKIRLRSVYSGTTFGDTPLSEVRVYDTSPDPATTVTGVRVSTRLAADADSTYAADLTTDGLVDTLWCAHPKKGDGRGESLTVVFDGPTELSHFRVWNGDASSPEANAATSSASAISLAFDSGEPATAILAATADAQELTFPVHTTTNVTLTVTEVTPGATYPDLCLSEVEFSR